MRIPWNIANWQNNVAKDLEKEPFQVNLVNAILEIAYQLSVLNDNLLTGRFDTDIQFKPTMNVTLLPPKFYNKEGDLDLSQVTGEEALQYLQTIGLAFTNLRKPQTKVQQD